MYFSFTNLSYFAKSLNDAKGNRINKFILFCKIIKRWKRQSNKQNKTIRAGKNILYSSTIKRVSTGSMGYNKRKYLLSLDDNNRKTPKTKIGFTQTKIILKNQSKTQIMDSF